MDLHQIFQGGYTDYKWRQLGEYLKGKQLSAGAGIKLETSTSSGSVISAKKPREIRQSQAPPFSVLNTRATSSATGTITGPSRHGRSSPITTTRWRVK